MTTLSAQWSILAPAFVAGAVVLLSHVPLGREVLRRGIIFMDLAVAQFAGFGLLLASRLGMETHGWELQAVALVSALSGAALLGLAEKWSGAYHEALIGISFVLAATGSLLLLANHPQGGEHLQELLAGQILWVQWSQLLWPALVGVVVLALWFGRRAWFAGRFFYVLFAIAITVSVQLVGVYLVFASLILPALATIGRADGPAVLAALVIGAVAYASGLLLSATFDWPSGAVIVWTLAACAALGFKATRFKTDTAQ